MSWQDNLSYLNGGLHTEYKPPAPLRPPAFRPPAFRSAPTWGQFVARPGAGAASRDRFGQTVPANPPEKFNVDLYKPPDPPPAAPVSTEGDWLGSIGGALGNLTNVLNPANAIPWVMERVSAASHALGDTFEDAHIPVAGEVFHAVGNAEDVFLNAVHGMADAIGPVMQGPLNWYRDTNLTANAMAYATIAQGREPDNSFDPQYFAHSMTLSMEVKRGTMTPEERRQIELELIDLPPSVKKELIRNPYVDEAAINKLFDAAPEGRQFSYDPGPAGALRNFSVPMVYYLAGFKGALGAGGAARAGLEGAAATGGVRGALASGAVKGLYAGGTIAGRSVPGAITLAAKMQGLALWTGATYTAIQTGADVVARVSGNQAAVDWIDKVNRTAVISDSPNVQLVTGFTVNPFTHLGLLKTGVVRLAHGVGDVTVGKVLGKRMANYYTHETLVDDQIRRMYRLGSTAEAKEFIDKNLDGRGQAYDQVTKLALQTVVERLPDAERAYLAALPSIDMLHVALRLHGNEAFRLLEQEPEMLANRWYQEFWLDRGMTGPFDSEVAALISRDKYGGDVKSYEFRSKINAVLGRADYIPPAGVSHARDWLDQFTDADGNVPIKGTSGFQDLQRQLPALHKYVQGLVVPKSTSIPRTAIETMLERAEQDYAALEKRSPIKASTGVDPILRPNATHRDYSDALGTTERTIAQVFDSTPPDGPVDLLRPFLVEKVGLDPALVAAMPPEEVWTRASEYVDTTTAPWLAMGTRVASAERSIMGLRSELVRMRGLPKGARDRTYSDRVIRLEKQLAEMNDLVALAADPPVPFSESLRGGRRESRTAAASVHREEMAARRAEALTRLETLEAIETMPVVAHVSAIGTAPWHELMRETPIGHVLAWAGGASPMSAGFRRRFAEYLRTTTDTGPGAESAGLRRAQAYGLLVDMGDEEAWDLFRRHPQALARMTKTQQRYARAAERGAGADEYATDYPHEKVGMNATDAFLEDLGEAIGLREQALEGRSLYSITRTANLKVDDPSLHWWEQSLIADPKSPIYDPEFVAITHPHNIMRVVNILDRPDDLYPGLETIVKNDPVMMHTISMAEQEAEYSGGVAANLLTDPTNAPIVRSLLVPDGWMAPEPGIVPATPLDELLVAGDTESLAAMSEQLMAARVESGPPLNVPLSTAKRLAGASRVRRAAAPDSVHVHFTLERNLAAIRREGLQGDTYFWQRGEADLGAMQHDLERRAAAAVGTGAHAALAERVAVAAQGGATDAAVARLVQGELPALRAGGYDAGEVAALERLVASVIDGTRTGRFSAVSDIQASVEQLKHVATADTARTGIEIGIHPRAVRRSIPDPEFAGQTHEGLARITSDRIPPEDLFVRSASGGWEPLVPRPGRLSNGGTARPSHEWRQQLSALGADMRAAPGDAILVNPANRIGLDALSWLTHGVAGRPPQTIGGVLRVLREIENGNAERAGMGAPVQAEGQRVAREILTDARNAVKRAGLPPEAMGKGLDWAMLDVNDGELARALTHEGILYYDEADPLGSMQYILKRPPKNAVVQEWHTVPGLAEEFLSGHFEPWNERVWTASARKTLGFLFGRHSNASIEAASKVNFIERATQAGITAKDATLVWNRWKDVTRASRGTSVRRRVGNVTGLTVREHVPGDSALYASVKNLPGRKLDAEAQEALGTRDGLVGPAQGVNMLERDPAYHELIMSTDFGTMFREASSPVRRWLAGESIQIGGTLPKQVSPFAKAPTLGRAIAGAYGLVAHNSAVTTMYYLFRFGLDLRFHAMNYFESQILYLGRAGLRDGEVTSGYLGQTDVAMRKLDEDVANNTGYAVGRTRAEMMYKTFLKEQPDALRGAIGDIQRTDEHLMAQAMEEIAAKDPQIAEMLVEFGDTPQGYLKVLNAWHEKLLATADDAEAAEVINAGLAPALAETPALEEIYGRLAQVNRELIEDTRQTFYGNPDRSRAERFLNSYLLYWPLSYQIKAAKWLVRVMYDRAGGLPTNGAGAVILTRFADTHKQLLATDPEYAEWFEKHKTLVFVAQMLVPITPSSMGVTLNPILRDIFFERTKEPYVIGPVYTLTEILPDLAKEINADLYPTLADVPGWDALYRMTGQKPPKKPGE